MSMNLLMLSYVISGMIFFASGAALARTCEGCKQLNALHKEFVDTVGKDDQIHYPFVRKVAAAIGKLKKKADGTLDNQQIDTIIVFMNDERNRIHRQMLVEKNHILFKDNRKLFAQRLKAKPVSDGTMVMKDIDVVLDEYEFGQDPMPERAPRPTDSKE